MEKIKRFFKMSYGHLTSFGLVWISCITLVQAQNVVINEIMADPADDLTGDANGDGIREENSDEFVEIVNVSGAPLDISGWTLSDDDAVRHVFPPYTVLATGQAIVVFGGQTPTGFFGGSLVQVASTGTLSADLMDGFIVNSPAPEYQLQYFNFSDDDQSNTLQPDLIGFLDLHSFAAGALGALFSPGTFVDGSLFPFTVPSLLSTSPTDDSTAVPIGANLIFKFDTDMAIGNGRIIIKRADNDSDFSVIDVTGGNVTTTSDTVIVDIPIDLLPGTDYYVLIDNGALVDANTNDPFQGISDESTFNFQTNFAPELVNAIGASVPRIEGIDGPIISLAGRFSDVEDSEAELIYAVVSDNPGLVNPILNGLDLTLDVADQGISPGGVRITITVTDSQGLTVTDQFLTVISPAQVSFNISGEVTAEEDNIGIHTFTIVKTGTTAQTETLALALQGTAANLVDINNLTGLPGLSGSIDFEPDSTTKTVTLQVVADDFVEQDELLTLITDAGTGSAASSTGNTEFTIGSDQATVSILNDDSTTLTLEATLPNGQEGATPVDGAFTIFTDKPFEVDEPINLIITGTANGSQDYTAINVTDYPANETNFVIPVEVINDLLVEGPETVIATLQGSTASDALAMISTTTFEDSVTIQDDDFATLSVSPTSPLAEEPATNGAFTVFSTLTIGNPITVDLEISGTATAGDDYVTIANTITLQPGQNQQVIPVTVLEDFTDEVDLETVVLTLIGDDSPNASIDPTQNTAVVNINDVDEAFIEVGTDFSLDEGTNEVVNAVFTVRLTLAIEKEITVNYETIDGLALAGEDYTAVNGTLMFDASDTSQNPSRQISVPITTDNKFEVDQDFTLRLSNSVGANIGLANQNAVLINDDSRPEISVNSVTVNERDLEAVVEVTLSNPTDEIVNVNFSTTSGTATGGNDFTEVNIPLQFDGLEAQMVSIPIIDDEFDEEDTEFFTVRLQGAQNATLNAGQSEGTVTIIDDDGLPTFTVDAPDQTEGDSDNEFTFTITLDSLTEREVAVDYTVLSGNGTATPILDFAESGPETLIFPPGTTSLEVKAQVIGDLLNEDDETFTLELSNPQNSLILQAMQNTPITIIDDDPLPIVSVNSVVTSEDNPSFEIIFFTISLNTPSGRDVSLDYTINNGTAVEGLDYQAMTSGNLVIPEGETEVTVDVVIIDDNIDEDDETLFITLSNLMNAELNPSASAATGTIIDDDLPPEVLIDDAGSPEGIIGQNRMVRFPITLSHPSSRSISIDYETADRTATLADNDYITSVGTLEISPLDTTAIITVLTVGDNVLEDDETFELNLLSANNANLVLTNAIGTIENDDVGPTLTVEDVVVNEGDGFATFVVRLSQSIGLSSSFTYATQDNTAASFNGDFEAVDPFTITFDPGETQDIIRITVNDDEMDEDEEMFTLFLDNASNLEIDRSEVTATIIDNDDPPSLFINDATVVEGDGEPVAAVLTVSLSTPSGKMVRVNYSTQNNTALSTQDYQAVSGGTLTFDPGTQFQNIEVQVIGDSENEAQESFFVNLSGAENAVIQDGQGEATIFDNDVVVVSAEQDFYQTDEEVTLQVPAPGVLENDESSRGGELTARLVEPAANGILNLLPDGRIIYTPNVDFSGVDRFTYQAADGDTLSFPTTVNITVNPINDGPTIGQIANQTMLENTTLGPLKFDIDDIDTPGDQLTLESLSANPGLIPQENIILESNGTDGFITITPAPDQTGTVLISVLVSDGEFSAEVEFTVTILESNRPPRDLELSNDVVDAQAESGTFIGIFTVFDPGDTHQYTLSNGPGSADNNQFEIRGDSLFTSADFNPGTLDELTIGVTVVDSDMETLVGSFLINVIQPEVSNRIFIPNLFSPNGDGNNDTFRVRSNDITSINMRVFNRMGELVFETDDVNNATNRGWDGNFNGRAQPPGTYIWQVYGTLGDGTPINFNGDNFGNVTLIR